MRNLTSVFACAGLALFLAACSSGGGGSSNNGSNAAPTANAGPAQAVNAGTTVGLNGSQSSDSDGSVVSYTWTQTAGTPAVTLTNPTTSQPTFTAPTVTATTTFTFSLVVTDNRGAASTNAATVNVVVDPAGTGQVNVTGRITFERIPFSANPNVGLNYAAAVTPPARGVTVRAMNGAIVAATGTTNASGDYSLTVGANLPITIVVVAEMVRDASQPAPRWNFRVADIDASTTAYTYQSAAFNSSSGVAQNVTIPSGLSTTGQVTGTRASAPFAILDTIYTAREAVLGVAPTTIFPTLYLDWASSNPGGETFFDAGGSAGQTIVLSADPTEDTDEFDQHVIAHEFGHYIEYNFSRADNIGGAHGRGDKLDPRVAFGEGFGYAFAGIVLNDPVARDSFVNAGNQVSSTFNVETNPPTNPVGAPLEDYGCWCSESTVWALLWDFYDTTPEANDAVSLGFQPLWNVLVSEQRTTPSFTTIFSFATALKAAQPGSVAGIDSLLNAQNITATGIDIYGTAETNAPPSVQSAGALPVYTRVFPLNTPVVVRSVNDAGHYNALGNQRFVRFTLPTSRSVTITVSTNNPAADADPDFYVMRAGTYVMVEEDAPPGPEVGTATLAAGDYVMSVYDCANGCGTDQGTPGDYDLTVTIN